MNDQYGCRKRDTVNVSVRDCGECTVFMPSSFTPNGDGRNDLFRGRLSCQSVELKHYRLGIYNRWGQQVFQSNSLQKGWDGNGSNKPHPAGTYVYLVEYAYGQSGAKTARGTVTLLR